MTTPPVVSVVIPAYNAERWLRETIDSVLVQSLPDFELIVINDASNDETGNVAKSAGDQRIRVVDNERNIGVASSRNVGIEVSRGEFIAFLDADDIAVPHRLERQVGFFRRNLDIGICGGWAQTFGSRSEVWTAHPRHDQIKSELLYRSAFIQSTVMLRRDLLVRHDLRYDPTFILSEDYELWTRCEDVVCMANLGEILVRYRIHDQNASILGTDRMRGFSKRIRLRQLHKLGLAPTDEEADLHEALCNYGPTGPGVVAFDLDAVERWLVRLRQANRQSGYIEDDSLTRLLYEFWRRCCRKDGKNSHFAMMRFLTSPVIAGTPIAWRLRDAAKIYLRKPVYPIPRR